MKVILDKNTGKILYSTSIDVELQENQISIDKILTEILIKPFYNFENKEFYEGATPEEIMEYQNKINLELKKQAHQQLSETDWYITRFIETGKPIPTEILEQRQLIRNII